jgi:RHH-type proline utilization regulon transcriptional repressor/proline dehydrogenase/delta 1-pyrroline-5-carboxylate dehydrogenase
MRNVIPYRGGLVNNSRGAPDGEPCGKKESPTPMTMSSARADMAALYLGDETRIVDALLPQAKLTAQQAQAAEALARDLVVRVRAQRRKGGLDAFLHQYALSTEEGVVLMCLAEALLRIPDAGTADRLIRDKVGPAQWEKHLGRSGSLFVNASTWGLMLTGRVVKLGDVTEPDWSNLFGRIVARSGEPVIRQAMYAAMRMMGGQFVLGRTIEEALDRGRDVRDKGFRFSFDMLGEAAMTADDAARYLASYHKAVEAVGADAAKRKAPVIEADSISVKLSALHPRFEALKLARLERELLPAVAGLGAKARALGIGLTVDAEEADRLELTLDLFAALGRTPELKGWEGLGLAVQAYQKRAVAAIDWLAGLARAEGRRIPVRLVKGAYWDSEIKRAQEQGLGGYPVFTRKASTDVSYLACARKILSAPDAFYPMFATHNAHTVAAVRALAGDSRDYEYQRLHGMGEALYDEVAGPDHLGVACRIYAPVGAHEDLLAYLVRRLLENGANSSFVNRLADDEAPIADIIADPVAVTLAANPKPHPRIPLPRDLFPGRQNSRGLLLSDPAQSAPFLDKVAAAARQPFTAQPVVGGVPMEAPFADMADPADRRRKAGRVAEATAAHVEEALRSAAGAFPAWDRLGGTARAAILESAADLYEAEMPALVALCVREAGKTLANAIADVREAVDFLRYYAGQARAGFSRPLTLPGPTGERNELSLSGRGVFACIAPWNFPVAIFTGQVAAALAAGNTVIAKPAEQTPGAAALCVALLLKAGVPGGALQFLPGDGARVGAALVRDPRVAGVAFTGSTDTARIINRTLAARDGAIPVLIAETGGLNAMIADSTALPEQLVRDAVASAFDSAGQRCSALRVLFVQEDIADKVVKMLAGAMAELKLGDPMALDTDIGPLIDAEALETLRAHASRMEREGRLIAKTLVPPETKEGFFFAPCAFEIATMSALTRETFGPVLHVVRFQGAKLSQVCEAVNAAGYGLTIGVHTRIEETVAAVRAQVRAGNLYVNRNQIGAVVGAQPFGGEGLSGTGPKAGGPHYLHRFAVERTACVNTTAAGGNATLMAMGEAG